MANNYFEFKQFKVWQDKAAMKVGTDGVLLGAWVDITECINILDVGTGTGLISLMLAQRHEKAKITAIDIDQDACDQALLNFEKSKWGQRLEVINHPFQVFRQKNAKQFDLVVCNPPFFHDSFKSACSKRNLARHSDALSMEELIANAASVSVNSAKLAVVLPKNQSDQFITLANKYFYNLVRVLNVKPNKCKKAKRCLLELQKNFDGECQVSEICIETTARHVYSNEYKELTKDFYLAF